MFWVHASNAARFEQSYRDIANCVKVPGRQNPKEDIFQLVHNWLQDEGKGRWFLILNNVDNASFLLEARSAGRDGETSSIEGKKLAATYKLRSATLEWIGSYHDTQQECGATAG